MNQNKFELKKIKENTKTIVGKLQLQEGNNIIIPGDDDGAVIDMFIGAGGMLVCAITKWSTVIIGGAAIPAGVLVGGGFVIKGLMKASEFEKDEFWNRVFKRCEISAKGKYPKLINSSNNNDGEKFRWFEFNLPMGLSIKDVKAKQDQIENAVKRPIKISLNEDTYRVIITMPKSK